MKTELKLNTDAIIVLSKLLSGVYLGQPLTTLERVSKCVLMDVFDKVSAKAKDLQRKQSLFDSRKKVTLSLKFHQAYYLYEFIKDVEMFENDFQAAQIQKIFNLLDQKLC